MNSWKSGSTSKDMPPEERWEPGTRIITPGGYHGELEKIGENSGREGPIAWVLLDDDREGSRKDYWFRSLRREPPEETAAALAKRDRIRCAKCSVCTEYVCSAQPPHRIGHIRQTISQETGRPITPSLLMARATNLAISASHVEYDKIWSSDEIADALHEELIVRGWAVSDEDV